MFALATYAHDCLPRRLKKIKRDSKYIVKTVKGDTYEEAAEKLAFGLPKAGFLQKIDVKSTRYLSNKNYSESYRIKNAVKANVEMYKTYECKYHGEFYITAVIAKEDITYAEYDALKEISLKQLKKFCKDKKITLVISNTDESYEYWADKRKQLTTRKKLKKKYGYHTLYSSSAVFCGDFKMVAGKIKDTNLKHSFKAIELTFMSDGGMGYEDKTLDVWLELTK